MNSDVFDPRSGRQLKTSIRSPSDLAPHERRQMFRLMSQHFENVDADQFERDLAEKQWIVTVSDPAGGILGFTSVMWLKKKIGGETVTALFSGDTLLSPQIRGTSTWIRLLAQLGEALLKTGPKGPVYWLLVTSTHRTYRSLPLLFKEYYPRPDAQTPPDVLRRMAALARMRFPEEYDERQGIVRLRSPTPVRPQRVALATERLSGMHAEFFAARNPGFLNGDYLVCICDLSRDNRTRLGSRLIVDRQSIL
jgi:hypothetical protein